MKSALSILLTVFVALACSQSKHDVLPSDKLYKRWKSVETGRDGKDWRDVTTPEIIEFRPDGMIKYENQSFLCCAPIKVDRQQNIMKVIETGDSNPYCASVDCVGVSELQILSLSDTDLVIDYWQGKASMYTVYYVAAN